MTANVQKVFQNGEEVTNRDCFIKGTFIVRLSRLVGTYCI